MPDPFHMLGDIVTYDLLRLTAETRLADAVHFFVMDVSKILAKSFSCWCW